MDTIKAILGHYPKGLMIEVLLYGSILSLGYYIVWNKFKTRLKNWRVQLVQRANRAQFKSELKNSALTLLVWAFYDSIILFLYSQGLNKMYVNFSDYGLLMAVATFFVMLVVDDAWFYWTHRFMHSPAVYRFAHAEHHKSIDVTPYTSLSFHMIESMILPLWIFAVSFLVPLYLPVMFLFQLWAVLNNLKGHMGYEFFPANTNKSWLRYFTTSTHHNLHHSKFNGNYGLHFRFWDRLMGTEFKEYEEVFEQVQTRKKEGLKKDRNFTPLVISAIKDETEDAYSVYFHTVPSVFLNFKVGQHITIRVSIDNTFHLRTFSLSSSPEDDFLRITIKKVGLVTRFIRANLKPGDVIEAFPPTGLFKVEVNPAHRLHYVMIAAGSGITPILSMTKAILKQEPLSKVTLLYANKSAKTKIFTGELQDLQKAHHQLALTDFFGGNKISRSDLEKALLAQTYAVKSYICGPKGFMDAIAGELVYLGLEKENILTEEFAPSAVKNESLPTGDIVADGIIHFSEKHHLQILENESILDAMIRNDIQAPYSCKSGICGTCKCKLIGGQVDMNAQKALNEQEIADGFILSCQSFPKSKLIEIKI